MSRCLFIYMFAVFTQIALTAEPNKEISKYWSSWRGPTENGVAIDGNPPVEWSEDKNVRWKIAIPGKSHATPVIWEDQMFVLTAVETDKLVEKANLEAQQQQSGRRSRGTQPTNIVQFKILSINPETGKINWDKLCREQLPHAGIHNTTTWASASAVTDGQYVLAHFGSYGLYCYDLSGNLKWEKDFGDMQTRGSFGEGSSPALYDDTVVVLWDNEDQSYIYAVDKHTGKQLWRRERDERTTWSTPFVLEVNGKAQVVVNATNKIRSYDLDSGEIVWELGGMTDNVIPSPVYEDGIIYLMSGFRGAAVRAVRIADAKGDITGTDIVVWEYNRDTPYVPSPVLYDGQLYFLKDRKGILTSLNAKDGSLLFGPQRLDGIQGVYASPVAAANRIAGFRRTLLLYPLATAPPGVAGVSHVTR